MGSYEFVVNSTIAGIIASVACGLGALPLLIRQFDITKRVSLGYGFAGGLMFAASVYNLLLPALNHDPGILNTKKVILTLLGIFSGCAFLWGVERSLTTEKIAHSFLRMIGSKREVLIFIAMTLHSIPEGVAVGVGYGSTEQLKANPQLGHYIATAIAIHNIPEGLAVAIPLRAHGASISKCFSLAFLTSLPQPIAAVPASLLVSIFSPLMVPFLGFAAGAMMFLVLVELIPDALEDQSANTIAWVFMFGFGTLILIQVIF